MRPIMQLHLCDQYVKRQRHRCCETSATYNECDVANAVRNMLQIIDVEDSSCHFFPSFTIQIILTILLLLFSLFYCYMRHEVHESIRIINFSIFNILN